MHKLIKRMLCLSIILAINNLYALSLEECGKVIAYENGIYNFFPLSICKTINTCPQQFDEILKYNQTQPIASKQIHFAKIFIRTLKDNTWVVAHDQYQYAEVPTTVLNDIKPIPGVIDIIDDPKQSPITPKAGFKAVRVNLSEINSEQLAYYQQYNLGVYRLSEYVAHDKNGQLCYMLFFKTDPNENILNEIEALGVNNRTLLESRNSEEIAWLNNHQTPAGIWFTARIDSNEQLDWLLAKEYDHLWAIEVNKNNNTKELVTRINTQTPYVSEVDSMPYDSLQEVFKTACRVPLEKMGSRITMTSRPVDCLKEIN